MLNPNNLLKTLIVLIVLCTSKLLSDNNPEEVKSLFKTALKKQLEIPTDSKIIMSQYRYFYSEIHDSVRTFDTTNVTLYVSRKRILFVSPKMISLQADTLLYTIVPLKNMIIVMNYDQQNFLKNSYNQQLEFYSKLLDSSGNFNYQSDSEFLTIFLSDSIQGKFYDKVDLRFRIFDDEILSTDINYSFEGKKVGTMTTNMLNINRNYIFSPADENSFLFHAGETNELTSLNKFKTFKVYDTRKNNKNK